MNLVPAEAGKSIKSAAGHEMELLEDLLLKDGKINIEQLEKVKASDVAGGKTFTTLLLESGLIQEEEILKNICQILDIPFNKLSDLNEISIPEIITTIAANYMRENKFVPIDLEESKLTIATANPLEFSLRDELSEMTGYEIELQASLENDIAVAIERFFGAGSSSMSGIIDDMGEEDLDLVDIDSDDVEHLKDLASEAPVIKLVNLIITRAIEIGASDIHIEPFDNTLLLRYRVDGVLQKVESPPKRLQGALISRLKIMAKLNIAERRLPQDGRIKFNVVGKNIDMRVSTLPTVFGESVVLRILDRSRGHHQLKNIGLAGKAAEQFEELISKPYGMLLATGPTGSGKTTTLYSGMEKINKPNVKIVTIEDPVEYQMNGINQIHVKPSIGLTFANGLRSIVRQDPDVIMVGEIRDAETAAIAIQSALTGHMVFSTIHTNDAAGAITRLQDMDVESFLISSALLGVLAQRLVRVICENCKVRDEIKKSLVKGLEVDDPQDEIIAWRGKGCHLCNNTGYKGRMGIFELLIISDEIRSLILQKANSNQIKAKARKLGMQTLREDGWQKVKMGVTSLEEVLRVTVEEDL